MRKIAVAITGASGSIYAQDLLEKLCRMTDQIAEISLVMSTNAREVWQTELDNDSWKEFTVRRFETHDFSAPIASGSGQYDTLIVIPCSMGTLGRIANGISGDLITRAADVILKERRRLILVARPSQASSSPALSSTDQPSYGQTHSGVPLLFRPTSWPLRQ